MRRAEIFAMAEQSTPIRRSPESDERAANRSTTNAKEFRKSPQVRFDMQSEKIEGIKNERGLDKLRKIRENLAEKEGDRKVLKASPSRLFARSMLSFDLERGGLDEIPVCEDELFVKFVTDRRKSSGRGTLRTLINKRINLQVGAYAIAQREASKEVKKVANEKDRGEEVMRKKASGKKKRLKPVLENHITFSEPEQSPGDDKLEIPLGQEDAITTDFEDEESSDLLLSQTQVLNREEPLEFMGTPLRLDTVREHEESVPCKVRKQVIKKNHFVDDEAEESEDCRFSRNGDDDSSAHEGSDLSDLIASSSGEDASNDEDPFLHARVHGEWLIEKENEVLNRLEEPNYIDERRSARKRGLLAAVMLINRPQNNVRRKEAKLEKPVIIKQPPPVRVALPKFNTRPRKYSKRKSSVSSCCTELREIVKSDITQVRQAGGFSFLSGPSETALAAIHERVGVKNDALTKNASGARLMGSKRFVFGN